MLQYIGIVILLIISSVSFGMQYEHMISIQILKLLRSFLSSIWGIFFSAFGYSFSLIMF